MPSPSRNQDLIRAVGKRLGLARNALGLSQEQLAEEIGVTRATLGNWEQGTRLADVSAMVRFSARYGIPLDWVYRDDPSQLPHSIASHVLTNNR